MLDRVNREFVSRREEADDMARDIKSRLAGFNSNMMDLRDALNEAVNNTARAAEINNMNEKTLEDNKVSEGDESSQEARGSRRSLTSLCQRRLDELLSKQREVNDLLNMAEDDVAQVNDLLSMLQDSKEVGTHKDPQRHTKTHTLQQCLIKK